MTILKHVTKKNTYNIITGRIILFRKKIKKPSPKIGMASNDCLPYEILTAALPEQSLI